MKTFVVFSFLMAFVMATASQEATEIEGNDLPKAGEIVDFEAKKQAEDTPSFKNADFGRLFHRLF